MDFKSLAGATGQTNSSTPECLLKLCLTEISFVNHGTLMLVNKVNLQFCSLSVGRRFPSSKMPLLSALKKPARHHQIPKGRVNATDQWRKTESNLNATPYSRECSSFSRLRELRGQKPMYCIYFFEQKANNRVRKSVLQV